MKRLESFAAAVAAELFNTDPIACHHLKPFSGQVVEISITDWGKTRVLILSSGQLVAPHHQGTSAQLMVHGTLQDFQALVQKQPSAKLHIQGDVALSRAIAEAFDCLSVDWVQFLRPWVGPTIASTFVAHFPFEMAKQKGGDWFEDAQALRNSLLTWWNK